MTTTSLPATRLFVAEAFPTTGRVLLSLDAHTARDLAQAWEFAHSRPDGFSTDVHPDWFDQAAHLQFHAARALTRPPVTPREEWVLTPLTVTAPPRLRIVGSA